MQTYLYIARDSSGIKKEGLRQAGSSNEVLNWLREQKLTPVSVQEKSATVKPTRRVGGKKRIKSSDLAAVCWQLTTLVEGGIPITTALGTIAEDIENPYLQQVRLSKRSYPR